MLRIRLWVAVAMFCSGAALLHAEDARPGENLVSVKLALPKGDVYMRGATDPVADLAVSVVLANRTPKENLGKETIPVTTVARLTPDELNEMNQLSVQQKLSLDDQKERVSKKKVLSSKDVYPTNKDSLGVAYVEPRLGVYDTIKFVIAKLPEDGEAAPEGAKPVIVARDNVPDHIGSWDSSATHYLAAGESSPAYTLEVGKYYLIRSPGRYSIKAILPFIQNGDSASGRAESNEETFRVLPLKVTDRKIEDVKDHWNEFERGMPSYDYMLFEVKNSGGWNDLYCVQRIPVEKDCRWEWTRICTVKEGTQPQLAQLGSKKVAVLAAQEKGDAGLYTLDFSKPGVKIDAKSYEIKDGNLPKLKVEGGAASVE